METTGRVWVAATLDTKSDEANYVSTLLEAAGVSIALADLSTSGSSVLASHREYVFRQKTSRRITRNPGRGIHRRPGNRNRSNERAFERFVKSRNDIGGMLGLGGSGGTAMITRAMRALPTGVPKLMVSTMASGNVSAYVGACDITMAYSVTDMTGLNRISRRVLGNAAHAVAGMMLHSVPEAGEERPAIGLTMFGVTTACVQQISRLLADRFDCIVFHATGTGGQSMEKLLEDGYLGGVLDITTTEVCDHLFGGVLACTDDRFGAVARTQTPYVGSCGALDMVNFGAPETVPERYRGRKFYRTTRRSR